MRDQICPLLHTATTAHIWTVTAHTAAATAHTHTLSDLLRQPMKKIAKPFFCFRFFGIFNIFSHN